jgi:hypothetical protein
VRKIMRVSKSFILIASILLVLVGAALGYSVKMFLQVGDMSHQLKLLDYDVRRWNTGSSSWKIRRSAWTCEAKVIFHLTG